MNCRIYCNIHGKKLAVNIEAEDRKEARRLFFDGVQIDKIDYTPTPGVELLKTILGMK